MCVGEEERRLPLIPILDLLTFRGITLDGIGETEAMDISKCWI